MFKQRLTEPVCLGALFHTGSYFMWRWMIVYTTQTPCGQDKIRFTASTFCTCYPLWSDGRKSEIHRQTRQAPESETVNTCFYVGSPSLVLLVFGEITRSIPPQKRATSVSGWEVIGQSCGNVQGPDWQRAWHSLSSLSGFYLVRFTGYWSQHHRGWWRVEPVL